MSQPHSNVLTYPAAIDAFNRNDVAGVAEHVRVDFVDRLLGRSIVAGELDGVEGGVAEGQVFLSDPDQVEAFWNDAVA